MAQATTQAFSARNAECAVVNLAFSYLARGLSPGFFVLGLLALSLFFLTVFSSMLDPPENICSSGKGWEMKRGALIAGLISGALCAGCVFAYSVQVRGEADEARIEAMQRYGGEQVDVLVATKDIYPGETVHASNAEVKTWLSDLLPSGCVTSFDGVKGVQAASLIISGEAISHRRFDSGGSGIDVPQGCVALSVPAEDVQAVGGALSAGDVVDVYATGSQTACIGKQIMVLATNVEHSSGTKAKVSWVTLAVPVEQSQEFVTASQSMDIYFVLPASEVDRQLSEQGQIGKQDDSPNSSQHEGR